MLRIVVGLCLSSCLLVSGRIRADPWQKLQARGSVAYYADDDLRQAFVKFRPKSLPKFDGKLLNPKAKSFDWSILVPPPEIKNQGSNPNCWAYASVSAFEYNWLIRNGGKLPPLSVQPLVDRCGKNGSNSSDQAYRDLLAHGTCPSADYPGDGMAGPLHKEIKTPYRAIAWGAVTPGEKGEPAVARIKAALIDNGPVTTIFQLTPAFMKHKGGVFAEHFQAKPDEKPSSHVFLIVGWDDNRGKVGCWKIQNSWGSGWCDGGFAWIEYGSNDIGKFARWIRAQTSAYQLPKDINKKIGAEVEPFPDWPKAAKLTWKRPSLKAISPRKALKKIGARVRVVFPVVQVCTINDGERLDLWNATSWKDAGCLAIRLRNEYMEKSKLNCEALVKLLKGRTVLATGWVEPNPTEVGDRPFIEISDPRQIKILH